MACKRGGRELPAYYEQSRSANIAENERKMRGLINLKKNLALGENRRQIAEVGSLSQPPKKKKSMNCTCEDRNGGHNLRSDYEDVEAPNYEPIQDGLEDSQGENMRRTRGGSKLPAYYKQLRHANIAENRRKLEALIELKRNLALVEKMRHAEEVGN